MTFSASFENFWEMKHVSNINKSYCPDKNLFLSLVVGNQNVIIAQKI